MKAFLAWLEGMNLFLHLTSSVQHGLKYWSRSSLKTYLSKAPLCYMLQHSIDYIFGGSNQNISNFFFSSLTFSK